MWWESQSNESGSKQDYLGQIEKGFQEKRQVMFNIPERMLVKPKAFIAFLTENSAARKIFDSLFHCWFYCKHQFVCFKSCLKLNLEYYFTFEINF